MIPPIPELEDYGLDPETGFIPPEAPLERLEDPYYAPWERLLDKFHGLLLAGRLREAVLRVPAFPFLSLKLSSDSLASCIIDIVSRYYSGEKTSIRGPLIPCAWLHMEWFQTG